MQLMSKQKFGMFWGHLEQWMHCIDRLYKNTCKLFYNYKLYEHIDPLNQMVHAEHTFVVLPCHNLHDKARKEEFIVYHNWWIALIAFTISSECSLTFNNFATPAGRTGHRFYSMFIFDLGYIKFKWIFATSKFATWTALVTSSQCSCTKTKDKRNKKNNSFNWHFNIKTSAITTTTTTTMQTND